MLPNQLEGKIGDVDQTEAYFIFCKEKDLTPQEITSQEKWQQIGPKSRAAYRDIIVLRLVFKVCHIVLKKRFGLDFIVMKINQRRGAIAQTSSDATRNKRVRALTKKTTRPLRRRPIPKTKREESGEVILELPSDSELRAQTCPYREGTRSDKYFMEPCLKIDGTYVDNFWEDLHATSASPTPSWSSNCESDCEVHRTYHVRSRSPNFWTGSKVSASGNVVKRRVCRFKRRLCKYISRSMSKCGRRIMSY